MTLDQAGVISLDAPLKMMMRDVRKVTASKEGYPYPWRIQFSNEVNRGSVTLEFKTIWLQGSVSKGGKESENITISDGSGEVQVTRCSRVPGDRAWIKQGAYCGVLASVIESSCLVPKVAAVKLMHVSDRRKEAECLWPLEVEELTHFLTGKITFKLNSS